MIVIYLIFNEADRHIFDDLRNLIVIYLIFNEADRHIYPMFNVKKIFLGIELKEAHLTHVNLKFRQGIAVGTFF